MNIFYVNNLLNAADLAALTIKVGDLVTMAIPGQSDSKVFAVTEVKLSGSVFHPVTKEHLTSVSIGYTSA